MVDAGCCSRRKAGLEGTRSLGHGGTAGEWSRELSALESIRLSWRDLVGFLGGGRPWSDSSIFASSVTKSAALLTELFLLRLPVASSSSCMLLVGVAWLAGFSLIHLGWLESLSELNSWTACWTLLVPVFHNEPAVFKMLVPSSAAIWAESFSPNVLEATALLGPRKSWPLAESSSALRPLRRSSPFLPLLLLRWASTCCLVSA